MIITDNIGIIADDLTGANECSLNFHLHGCSTEILIDYKNLEDIEFNKQVWTISTESRNIEPELAVEKVKEAVETLKNNFNIEFFYKKIDSTLRGNLAHEALTMLDVLEWEAALILPALPSENRITIGGYHLLKGVPIEKTEMARDPHSPIFESHIPTLLEKQLGENDLIGVLELTTVLKGAGPILMKLNELISQGKKLIVCDASSTTDIEQIALAMTKSNHKILPCGSSGLANALADIWVSEANYQKVLNALSNVPKFIISGSATELTKSQLERLDSDAIIDNTHFIPLSISDILNDNFEAIETNVLENLSKNNIVVLHSSSLYENEEELNCALIDAEITKEAFMSIICDFLAKIVENVSQKLNPIFITLGGETTYKCCKALDSTNLMLIDEVAHAIPLCVDKNSHWIISKSGNLGNTNTLVDIINYFNQYE